MADLIEPENQADIMARAAEADNTHDQLSRAVAEIERLQGLLTDKGKAPVQAAPSKPLSLGGEPVSHHLHLVDGRVISNHEGIGTHYSEVGPDGKDIVTRVKAHYPVVAADPSTLFA